ncbi:MAG: molybdopterin-dependent oxidoreductase [SAR324 cluster bacterium]|nr:molybdopterin-dependent oxidoreductase [SAR324 cluster bacterium]
MAKITRRKFIDLSKSAIVGGVAVAGASAFMSGKLEGAANQVDSSQKVSQGEWVIPSYCDVCFMGCGINVTVKNGRAIKIEGNPKHPISRGMLCPRGAGGLGQLYDPDRLKTPLIRTGNDQFKAVGWPEALDYVAAKMKTIIEAHGPESLALLKHGKGADPFGRLWDAIGSKTEGHPSYAQCRGARDIGWDLTFGQGPGAVERVGLDQAKVVAFIGGHLGENMHNVTVQDYTTGLRNGSQHIVVDPRYSTAASKARHWLPIRPGTDIALLLAWMHVLIYEDLYDKDFIEENAIGFSALKKHVENTTPEWAAPYTGLKADEIRQTAQELGQAIPHALLFPGRRFAWYGDDTQRARAMAIINALLGAWGNESGIFLGDKIKVPNFPYPASPHKAKHAFETKEKYPLGNSTPVQDIIDATIPGKLKGATQNAPVKGWMVYSTNLVRSVPNPDLIAEAVQHLDLMVVVETMPAEITGYADVILPDTTYLERYDVMNAPAWREPFVSIRQPVVKPLYQSRPSWWIAKELAERLGLGEHFNYKNFSEVIDYQLRQMGSSIKDINKKGGVLTKPYVKPEMKFKTPSRKVELYSKTMADAGHDPLPRFINHAQPPDNYYRLLYGRTPQHTFSRTSNNAMLLELFPENEIWVNPDIARVQNLTNGDYVSIKNKKGVKSNPIKVRVTKRIRQDCVFMAHGFGRTDRRLTKAFEVGADDNGMLSEYELDPIMGSTGSQVNFVTFDK